MAGLRTSVLLGAFLALSQLSGPVRADAVAPPRDGPQHKVARKKLARKKAVKSAKSDQQVASERALVEATAALAKAQEALAQAREASAEARAATSSARLAHYSAVQTVQDVEKLKAAVFPPAPPPGKPEPFAFADFTWVNGGARQTELPLDGKIFSGELRVDTAYTYQTNHPRDHTLVGSTNTLRTDEFQLNQFGVGGDFHHKNVHARLMTQLGLYSTSQPRNDPSGVIGQWDLDTAYRYISEAYGGYHLDKWYGINIDVGIFMSYVGLCSYYNADNWIYQMSYVSANTPWYFNGLRVQTFPTDHFKLEYWLVNGWQSYGRFSNGPGAGFSAQYRPTGNWYLVSNNYIGHDTLGNPKRQRWHSDNSAQHKYLERKGARGLSKAAFSFTFDAGAENGGGVSGFSDGDPFAPQQYFLGFMAYNRLWFHKDEYAFTFGGGSIHNPGRYLVLTPPVNGANAASGAGPFFTQAPGDDFRAWDASIAFDYMPREFLTHRVELVHREANVPYFAGGNGVTPETAPGVFSNTGAPGSAATNFDGSPFVPDLRNHETRVNYALMVKM